jgi:hypothetical protein
MKAPFSLELDSAYAIMLMSNKHFARKAPNALDEQNFVKMKLS